MFNRNSSIVKIWYSAVTIGHYDISEVPKLSNLQVVVTELHNEVRRTEEIETLA